MKRNTPEYQTWLAGLHIGSTVVRPHEYGPGFDLVKIKGETPKRWKVGEHNMQVDKAIGAIIGSGDRGRFSTGKDYIEQVTGRHLDKKRREEMLKRFKEINTNWLTTATLEKIVQIAKAEEILPEKPAEPSPVFTAKEDPYARR